jgi:hypothetical protein
MRENRTVLHRLLPRLLSRKMTKYSFDHTGSAIPGGQTSCVKRRVLSASAEVQLCLLGLGRFPDIQRLWHRQPLRSKLLLIFLGYAPSYVMRTGLPGTLGWKHLSGRKRDAIPARVCIVTIGGCDTAWLENLVSGRASDSHNSAPANSIARWSIQYLCKWRAYCLRHLFAYSIDADNPTTRGVSLRPYQHVGPPLQFSL